MKAILILGFAALAAGCASFSGRGLEPGKATLDEVEKLMGPNAEQRAGPGGETVRYYSRLPNGRQTFAARFGADGRLIAIEPRLTEDNLKKLMPGSLAKEQVRDLLGPPWEIHQMARQERESWTYPMEGLTFPKHLYVIFSRDGVLRDVMFMDDPTVIQQEDNR
jgi:hypothetical protein